MMADSPTATISNVWPDIPLAPWKDTLRTVHMWAQVVGKVRLAHAPFVNHWWEVPLHVSTRGLTTTPIPFGNRLFEMEFDFLDHQLVVTTTDGDRQTLPLQPQSVADFYAAVMALLTRMDLATSIWTTPVEIDNPVPFEKNDTDKSYDGDAIQRYWRALVQASRVFTEFRARYTGKVSPVCFYWGSFDLNITRFSGRRAPPRCDVDPIRAESYTHEVAACGFWAGGDGTDAAAFYAYAMPEPKGYSDAIVNPATAAYNKAMGEFILPYDDVRTAKDPDATLLEFLQESYEAAANLADWPRADLEYSGLGYWKRVVKGAL